MKKVNFVHIGDLHISNRYPFNKNTSKGFVSDRLLDIRKNMFKVYEYCVANEVQFIIISGDVFDSCEPDVIERRIFIEWFLACRSAGIAIYAISGNHDVFNNVITSLHDIEMALNQYDRGHIVSYATGPIYLMHRGMKIGMLPYQSNSVLKSKKVRKGIRSKELDVFIMHGEIKNSIKRFDISSGDPIKADSGFGFKKISKLAKYVAMGHLHQPQQRANIVYGGCIVRRDFRYMYHKIGFYHVLNDDIKFVPLKDKKFVVKKGFNDLSGIKNNIVMFISEEKPSKEIKDRISRLKPYYYETRNKFKKLKKRKAKAHKYYSIEKDLEDYIESTDYEFKKEIKEEVNS